MKSVTKELMVNALKELLLVKPLNKITINEIVSKCDASKQTFYNHFQDKYTLFLFTVTTALQNNWDMAEKNASNFEQTVLCYCKALLAEQKFYSSIVKDAVAEKEMDNAVIKYTLNHFRARALKDADNQIISDEIELAILYYAFGCARLLTHWIQTGFKQSPEYIAKALCECMPEVLRKYQ